MSAAIVLTGLALNDPVPGAYIDVNFAQGDSAGDSSDIEVLLIGNMLSTGSATAGTQVYGPDTLVPLQTDTDAIALFGAGSELHRQFRRFAKVNKATTLRAIAVADPTGTAATGTVAYSGTPTGIGTARVYVYDEVIEYTFTASDTATTIATGITALINTQTTWGVTAASSTGTVTITAKQTGPRGNQIRFKSFVTFGLGVTATNGTDTTLASGATSDTNATALGTISSSRYYYVVSAASDSTQVGALASQVGLMAAPTTGIRQRLIFGSTDTLANTITIATTVNAARAECIWQEKGTWTASELAANQAAIITLFENKPNPRTNFASFGNDAVTDPYWLVPAARLQTAWPSRTSIKSALNNGISPVGVNPNGTTYLVNRITTRSLNGSVNDYRIRPAHKVTICDFFADDLMAKTVLQFSGKRISDDIVQGQRPPGPQVVTPTIYRGAIFTLIDFYDGNDLLQNVAAIKNGTVVQREANPRTRMSARVPIQPIDNAEQFAVALDQVAAILLFIGFGALGLLQHFFV